MTLPRHPASSRSSSRLAAALFLALASFATAVPYSGTVCSGAIDFDLQPSTDFTALDAQALLTLSDYPRWFESGCYHALQKYACMKAYLPAATTPDLGYCSAECLTIIDTCDSTIKLLRQGSQTIDFELLVQFQCGVISQSTCVNGGVLTQEAELEPVCPKPLLVPGDDHEGKLIKVDGTECVAPCPTVIYTDYEWELLQAVAFYCSLASCIGTLVIWITHTGNKYAMLRYLAFGLCLPMALVSLWIPINRVESQVCDGPAHYVVRGEWCLTQGTLAIWSFKWTEAWVLALSINLWLSVVRRVPATQLAGYRNYYTAFAIVYPTAITAAFFGLQNIGFDWFGRSGPVCLFLVSDEDIYYWTMHFATTNLSSAICFVLCGSCILYMNKTIMATRNTNASIKSNFLKLVKQLLKYNHRILLFVFFYCVVQFVVSGIVLREEFDDRGYEDSAEDLVGCLLENSDDNDPNYAQTICGARPDTRPPMYVAFITLLQGSSNGLFLFLVYGTDGRFTKFVHNIMTTSKASSSEEDSSTRRTSTSNKHQRNSTTTSSWSSFTQLFRYRSAQKPSKGSMGSLDLELPAVLDGKSGTGTPRGPRVPEPSSAVVHATPVEIDVAAAKQQRQNEKQSVEAALQSEPSDVDAADEGRADGDETDEHAFGDLADGEETKTEQVDAEEHVLLDGGHAHGDRHDKIEMMENEMHHHGRASSSSSTGVDPSRQKSMQVFFRKPSSEAISPRSSSSKRRRPESSSTSSVDAV